MEQRRKDAGRRRRARAKAARVMARRALTDAQVGEARRAYRAGATIADLARALSVSRKAAYNAAMGLACYAGRAGGELPAKPRPAHPPASLTTEQVIEARRRYAAGETLAGLTAAYGVAEATMHRALHGYGHYAEVHAPPIQARPGGRPREIDHEALAADALRMRDQGLTYVQIAERLDVSHTTVRELTSATKRTD